MAEIYTADEHGRIRARCENDNTPGNLTRVRLKGDFHWFSLRPVGDAGQVANTGTDGAAIGTAYTTLTQDVERAEWCETYVLDDGDRGVEIYLAHDTADGVTEIVTGRGRRE